MGGNFTFTKIRSPFEFDFKECVFYLEQSFGIKREQVNAIIKQLVSPKSIHPNKLYFYNLKLKQETVGFSVIYYLSELNIAYLDYIVVLPQYRSLGYGSVLYMHICLELKQLYPEISGIFYEVYNGDDKFIPRVNFFEKQGGELLEMDESCMCFSEVPVMFHSLNDEIKEACPVLCIFQTLKDILV